ncbi:MAG TPA: hypothetical protein VE781_01880, partial [Kineosporiaceae bacterium]|nr:hypothetical protein [Kineosporiaceae bacterium]
ITAKLRATVNSAVAGIMTANPTANSGWATGGVTLAAGSYKSQSVISVAKAQPTTISGPISVKSGGTVALKGLAVPGSTVDIYAMTGASSFGWVGSTMADSTGAWTWTSMPVTTQTTFLAKTATSTSAPVVVAVIKATVVAKATVTGTAIGGGKVRFTIHGTPKKAAPVTVYVKVGSHWVKVASGTTASNGVKTLTTIKLKAGLKVFKVTYAPKGAKAATKTLPVRVK